MNENFVAVLWILGLCLVTVLFITLGVSLVIAVWWGIVKIVAFLLATFVGTFVSTYHAIVK
jgi:hypothetical protein